MNLSEMVLSEFDQEMANTRKTLERVPDDKFAWKPHEKSTTLAGLATHLANIPGWTKNTFAQDELDFAPPGSEPFRLEEAKSRAEVLEAFDKNVTEGRAAIVNASNESWGQNWTLLNGGKKIFSMPRAAVMRGFVMNHMIHHRAQLGVYLRLLDVPVPAIYGPSADEGGF